MLRGEPVICWRHTAAGLGILASLPALAQDLGGAVTLDQVTIGARIETAWDPVDGYVAHQSATGTKTDTPLIETPQSVSVVTADEIEARAAQTLGNALRYTAGVSGEAYGSDLRGYGLPDSRLRYLG